MLHLEQLLVCFFFFAVTIPILSLETWFTHGDLAATNTIFASYTRLIIISFAGKGSVNVKEKPNGNATVTVLVGASGCPKL